jgi:phage gp29-like protein
MRTITTSRGVTIELDGDLLAVLEALFKTMWDRPDDYSYEHTVQEIQHVLGQLSEAECRQYLSEALFMSYTSYENGRLDGVMKKLDTTEP